MPTEDKVFGFTGVIGLGGRCIYSASWSGATVVRAWKGNRALMRDKQLSIIAFPGMTCSRVPEAKTRILEVEVMNRVRR